MLWGANEMGRENLRFGIKPPASSHPDYHKGADWIDYQIEADYSGIIAPGLPNEVIALGDKFGRIMNYGDGVYGVFRYSALRHDLVWLSALVRILGASSKP